MSFVKYFASVFSFTKIFHASRNFIADFTVKLGIIGTSLLLLNISTDLLYQNVDLKLIRRRFNVLVEESAFPFFVSRSKEVIFHTKSIKF